MKNVDTKALKDKKFSKKKGIILTAVLMLLMIGGVTVWFFLHKKAQNEEIQPPSIENMAEGIISASGLTSVGMTEEIWELDFLETELFIEESYLSVGDEVEENTAVFKVSEETLAEAAKELEDAVTEAELLYRQGKIDFETDKLEAESTCQTAAINQKYAQAEYNKAVSEAKSTVENLEAEVEKARELAEEYTKSVNEDYYRTYYKVDELYQLYYNHFNYLMEVYEKWEIEKLSDLYGNSSGTALTGTDSSDRAGQTGGGQTGMSGAQGSSDNEQKLSVYNLFDELVQQEADDYTEAKENYELASAKAEAGLDQAVSELAALEAELVLARTEYEKALITCKADYEITLAESSNAQTIYETTLQSLEEAYAELEEKKEEAEENLALFKETIGDGYFYTQSAGVIVMNMIRENTSLSGKSIIVAYSNPETVTISASVDQSDIASIEVGDSAYAVISEYGEFEGTVTAINPVTQAESRSSVTYQVTVNLEGDISGLESNLTAYIYFGMTREMRSQQENTKHSERGEAPEENRAGQEGGGE